MPINFPSYCFDLFNRKRLNTSEVRIGTVLIGGENPLCLQSMTTTNTMDTEKSVAQSIRMIDAGCEIVRLTAPSKNEALNLKHAPDIQATRLAFFLRIDALFLYPWLYVHCYSSIYNIFII